MRSLPLTRIPAAALLIDVFTGPIIDCENAMRWLKGILAFFFVLIAGVAAIVVWIWLSFPTTSYRYRLTIVVELDGRVHSGSSVIEVRYRFFPEFFSQLANGNQYERSVAGQAVLVELGEREVP